MITVRTCTDLGTIPNTARNEFSTSYTMYIVCLLLLLWLQSGCARTREPSPTRLVMSSPPATLCTLFIVVLMVAVRTCTDPGTIPKTACNEFSTSYTMYIVCLLLFLWLQSGHALTWEPSPTRLVTSSPPASLCTLFVYCCCYGYSQGVHGPGNHPKHGS